MWHNQFRFARSYRQNVNDKFAGNINPSDGYFGDYRVAVWMHAGLTVCHALLF